MITMEVCNEDFVNFAFVQIASTDQLSTSSLATIEQVQSKVYVLVK